MSTAVDTVKTLMGTLNKYVSREDYVGMIALDNAIRTSTYFEDTQDAIDRLANALKDTETYPDTDTRLKEATGMVLGAEKDFTVDTGAITGSNAGGSTVKNAQDIVPETGDLSTAELPTPGSTTPITYTGADGNSFTFYVKWPDSFTTIIHGFNENDGVSDEERVTDSRYYVDLNNFADDYFYYQTDTATSETVKSPTCAEYKEAIITLLKGLNTYWLKESAKLGYDSLGIALDGQTIEIGFLLGGMYDTFSAMTFTRRKNTQPADYIYMDVCLTPYAHISSTDPNGDVNYTGTGKEQIYADRLIAHEMVHALMFSNGTLKNSMPEIFTEGIADLVQGNDDYNSEQRDRMITLVNDSDTFTQAMVLTPGTGTPYSYPAGHMFLRYLAKQSLDLTPIIADSDQQQTFSYSTGNAVISGYKEGDVINYNLTDGAALRISSSNKFDDLLLAEHTANFADEKILAIRDVRGKLVTLNTSYGTWYAHMATSAGEVDGRTINGGANYEILFGADYENNTIHAGSGGSELWGGYGGNDELFGGSGVDAFNYNFGDGNDTFQNVESQDQVFIRDVVLSQISSAQFIDNGITAKFSDGATLTINGTPSTFGIEKDDKYTFYQADYQNKTFMAK